MNGTVLRQSGFTAAPGKAKHGIAKFGHDNHMSAAAVSNQL